MRSLRNVLSALNRPLPGWLTLILVFGAAAGAAVPVFNGSVHISTGGSIVDDNATGNDCVATNASRQYIYRPCSAEGTKVAFSAVTATNPSGNSEVSVDAQGGYSGYVDIHTPAKASFIQLYNDKVSPSNLTQGANIYAYMSGLAHAEIGQIEFGNAGGIARDQGGFIAFLTKKDDGTGNTNEALVLTPQAHIYMPGQQYFNRFTTPNACAGGIRCGTVTWTFATPFATTSGAAQRPDCPDAQVWDESSNATMWVVSVNSVSSTGASYNYAPLLGVGASHTIDIWAVCYSSGF